MSAEHYDTNIQHDSECNECRHNERLIKLLKERITEKDKEMEGLIEIHHAQDADLEEMIIGYGRWISDRIFTITSGGNVEKYDSEKQMFEAYKQSLIK